MKVKELKRLLEGVDDNHEVIIDIWEENMINPRANVKRVEDGFDWYSNTLIIVPDRRLTPMEMRIPKE
jgi:hypothetical protein